MLFSLVTLVLAQAQAADSSPIPPIRTVIVDRDNIEITQSCRLKIAASPIIDADGNGVIHITASDIAVEFAADSPALIGAKADQLPDSFAGTGIVITGKGVTLSAKVSGYKVGIHARNADGLTVHHCDVAGNYAQHLKSTPAAEDGADWLFPHQNDQNQWITQHGASLCVEDSQNVTLHDIRARRSQNGIILDTVNDSRVYDCDCSFLSGWGLAMWRSNRNMISRNAFDFCVRGYSHGVYNRGQDSAGILMFEQCCENVIAENSVTHGGDGFFGFAGKEALGEVNPRDDLQWYRGRGDNDNWFVRNDFSDAAAHGLELTFSFRNWIEGNRFSSNAICGIWGGYSQGMCIDENTFTSNGESAYGGERGGINIEHGSANDIVGNTFEHNKCGVRLWCDEDVSLRTLPWSLANYPSVPGGRILANRFRSGPVAIELRNAGQVQAANNDIVAMERTIDADTLSIVSAPPENDELGRCDAPHGAPEAIGSKKPVGARDALNGRQNIIMTEWGPWDHDSPLLRLTNAVASRAAHEWQLLQAAPITGTRFIDPPNKDEWSKRMGGIQWTQPFDGGQTITISAKPESGVYPYAVALVTGSGEHIARGVIVNAQWQVKFFPWTVDPRQDADGWRKESQAASAVATQLGALDLRFNNAGPSELKLDDAVTNARLPHDHFGTLASTTLHFPAGRWRLDTTSDDGIRVWLDDQLVIDDWTWHAPTKHNYDFEVQEPREVKIRVEHFELDGFSTLQVGIAPAE